jgi:hypothetical protein
MSNDYRKGFEDGIRCYAWWKDGVEYVGTTGKTLACALADFETVHNFNPPAATENSSLAAIGAAWRKDSSLEKWFPITAEQLARLKTDNIKLREALARLVGSDDEKELQGMEILIHNATHLSDEERMSTITAIRLLREIRP